MTETLLIMGYYSLAPIVTLMYYHFTKYVFEKIDELAEEDDNEL